MLYFLDVLCRDEDWELTGDGAWQRKPEPGPEGTGQGGEAGQRATMNGAEGGREPREGADGQLISLQ